MLTSSTSVAIKHKKGVLLSTDTMYNYGRLQIPYKSRIFVINGTIFSFNGSIADIQEVISIIEEENSLKAKTFLSKKDKTQNIYELEDENVEYNLYDKSKGLSTYMFAKFIERYMYQRRSQMKPLKINITIAGKLTEQEKDVIEDNHYTKFHQKEDDFFLASINERGLFYQSNVVCTGMAGHLITPFLRGEENEINEIVDFETAKKRIEKSMTTLFYRNCTANDKVAICSLEKEKILVKIVNLKSEWIDDKNAI